MSNASGPGDAYGTGGRNRDYPALSDEMRQAIMDGFNRDNPYFSGHLGFRVTDLRRGYSKLEVENRLELSNPAGIMHGGASFGLADTAVAAALLTIYGAGNALLTIEMKINYLEPILLGPVAAEAYVLRSSRRSAYAEVDLWSAGKLAARASTTYMIRPMEDVRSLIAAFHTQVGYAAMAGLVLALLLLALLPADRRMILRSIIFLVLSFLAETLASTFSGMGASTAADLAGAFAAIAVGVVVIRLAFLFFFRVVLRVVRLPVPRIIEDIAYAGAVLTWGLVWLRLAGVDFSSLVATSAVITAVIAFSMQETLGSILGGLALQFDRSIRVGDWVRFDDVSGRVVEIRWRYTAVETRNHETVYLPNGQLTKQRFTVIGSRADPQGLWRRWVWINIDISAPPTRVCEILERGIRNAEIPHVARNPPPQCVLMDFYDHGGRYAIRYWLTDPAVDDPTDSQVREHALAAITRAGMHLALPYQKHLVTKETEHLRTARHADEIQRRVEALSKVEIFAELTAQELGKVAEHLLYAPFVQGDTIIRQGAVAHWLYLVVDGEVDVWVESPRHERIHVDTVGAGSVLGEMGMMTGAARTAAATAHTDVECYRLDKTGFQEVIQARPDIADQISKVLAKRAGDLDAVREKARTEARPAEAHADILERIRNFFGLADRPAQS